MMKVKRGMEMSRTRRGLRMKREHLGVDSEDYLQMTLDYFLLIRYLIM